jgi:predicted permease
MLHNGLQTIRFATRSLCKNPGVTLAAIVTLTLGIGATTAVFSIVNSVLLRPLPFKDPDELVWIWSRRPDNNKAPFSLPDFLDHRDQNQTLEQIAAFGNTGLSLSGVERTDRLQALRVSANLFQLLGLRAAHGRLMNIQDDEPARRYVVVLTYECWQRRFASDSNIVGKSLILNGESYEVIGILPQNVSLPNPQAELAIPLAPDVDPLRTERSSVNFLRIIGRLKKGVTLRQAEADLTGIVEREREEYGDAYRKKTGINVVPLYEELVGASRTSLWILLGAVSLVLIIGCCNLAALLLTRLTARSREMAIKKALGASSGRLAWQLLIESLILSLIGGAGGLLLATAGVRALSFFGSDQLPRNQEMSIDLRVLTFGIAASVLCALLFGTLPALQVAMVEANSALKSTTRGSGAAARFNGWRSLLVIGEVALCFVLLIGTGLLIQSFVRVQSVALGFDPANTLALRLSLPKTTYETRSSVALFNEKLFTNIKTVAWCRRCWCCLDFANEWGRQHHRVQCRGPGYFCQRHAFCKLPRRHF